LSVSSNGCLCFCHRGASDKIVAFSRQVLRFHGSVVDADVVDQTGEEGAGRLGLAAADVIEELAVVLPAAPPVLRTDSSTAISAICQHFLRRISFFSRSWAKNGLAFANRGLSACQNSRSTVL